MDLTATNVNTVFTKALFKEDELVNGRPTIDPVISCGITFNVGFHPERLQQEKEAVQSMLLQLPTEFQKDGGGGMSFLNACMDRNGQQWGEHREIQALVCLGLALNLVEYCLPRELWPALPGGMPYFVVLNPTTQNTQ